MAFTTTSKLLGASGDLVSKLIIGIFRVTMWAIGVINLLTTSLCPSKYWCLRGSREVVKKTGAAVVLRL